VSQRARAASSSFRCKGNGNFVRYLTNACRVRRMRRCLLCITLLASFSVTSVAVAGTRDGKGVVGRSWISVTSGGAAVTSVNPRSVQRVYVNFVWRTPPRVDQAVRIGWKDPSGAIRAVWTNRTVASDKKGTRLFTWIRGSRLKQSGTWQAILTVGGVTRSVSSFRSAVPVAPPPPPPDPSPPPPNNGCDPNYEGACVPIVPYDLNCADIGAEVTVVGDDPNRFDADGDGHGCESYG
jgi:hypothetical protein